MKSERRHELQTNSLALWLRWRAPELWQIYGTKVLLGVIALLTIAVLIRWRINAPIQAARTAEGELTEARLQIQQLESGQLVPGESQKIRDLIQSALDRSTDPDIQAKGHNLLGDYYWTLAGLPIPPEATTRPSLKPDQPRDQLLAKAREAYELAAKTPTQLGDLTARARLGLAAIAETLAFEHDRQAGPKADPSKNPNWAVAREQYLAVANAPNVPQVLKDEATWHLATLQLLQKPIWIEAPAATQPAGGQAATTQPSAQAPAVPPTAPSSPATTRPVQ